MKTLTEWLARGSAPKRAKKRIPKVSKKRARELFIYNKLLPSWFAAHPVCEIGPVFHAAGIMVQCNRVTTHPHHVCGRIDKLLYDITNFKASCDGECHPQAVHFTHKAEAIHLGLLIQ